MPWLCFGNFIDELSDPQAIWVTLWVGLGLLTISLLILMRSRWGQARPLSKCVVLSILAHMWLLGYAYVTKLWDEPFPGPREKGVQVHLVVDDAAEATSPDAQPWSKLPSAPVVRPQPADPTRRDLTSTTQLPDHPPDHHQAAAPSVLASDEQRTTPEPPIDRLAGRQLADALPPALIEPPTSEPAPPPTTVDANQNQKKNPLVRVPLMPRTSTDRDAPQPAEAPAEAHIQRLADLPNSQDDAEALMAPRDDLSPAAVDELRPTTTSCPASPHSAAATKSAATPAHQPVGDRHETRRLLNGQALPELYQSRVVADRLREAQRRGGNAETEAAVEAALAWLAAHQSADGRWNADQLEAGRETNTLGHHRNRAGANADTGITGLAVLAFLGAGHTHLEGRYRQNVQRGLEFLLASQRPDGSLAGTASMFASMYCHGIATLALSEAYAMTADARIHSYVRRAADYTIRSQHPATGGWRYLPNDRGDTSQFGWQLMGLCSGELAGLEIPQPCRLGMRRFLSSVSSGQHGGLAAYRPGERPSPAMTAEALVCRAFLGIDRDNPAIDEAAALILQEAGTGRTNLYFWYYATIALYHLQDGHWDRWNSALQRELLHSQKPSGNLAGSWDPNTVWGGYGGRVYSTALATLCLEVYYRYLPLYGPTRTAWFPAR